MPVAHNPYSGWAAILYNRLATRGMDEGQPQFRSQGFARDDGLGSSPAPPPSPPPPSYPGLGNDPFMFTSKIAPRTYPTAATPTYPFGVNPEGVPYAGPAGGGTGPSGSTSGYTWATPQPAADYTWAPPGSGFPYGTNKEGVPKAGRVYPYGTNRAGVPYAGRVAGTGGATGGFGFGSLGGFPTKMNPRGGGWGSSMTALLGSLALGEYGGGQAPNLGLHFSP